MKLWIKDRLTWIDRQYPSVPKLSSKSGVVSSGTKVTLSGSGDIYYTLDGSDPRASGGSPAKAAKKYEGPITVDRETKLTVRTRRSSTWSAPAKATFTVSR
jgi:hypothetical protein